MYHQQNNGDKSTTLFFYTLLIIYKDYTLLFFLRWCIDDHIIAGAHTSTRNMHDHDERLGPPQHNRTNGPPLVPWFTQDKRGLRRMVSRTIGMFFVLFPYLLLFTKFTYSWTTGTTTTMTTIYLESVSQTMMMNFRRDFFDPLHEIANIGGSNGTSVLLMIYLHWCSMRSVIKLSALKVHPC